jgi:hypothetical protein
MQYPHSTIRGACVRNAGVGKRVCDMRGCACARYAGMRARWEQASAEMQEEILHLSVELRYQDQAKARDSTKLIDDACRHFNRAQAIVMEEKQATRVGLSSHGKAEWQVHDMAQVLRRPSQSMPAHSSLQNMPAPSGSRAAAASPSGCTRGNSSPLPQTPPQTVKGGEDTDDPKGTPIPQPWTDTPRVHTRLRWTSEVNTGPVSAAAASSMRGVSVNDTGAVGTEQAHVEERQALQERASAAVSPMSMFGKFGMEHTLQASKSFAVMEDWEGMAASTGESAVRVGSLLLGLWGQRASTSPLTDGDRPASCGDLVNESWRDVGEGHVANAVNAGDGQV